MFIFRPQPYLGNHWMEFRETFTEYIYGYGEAMHVKFYWSVI